MKIAESFNYFSVFHGCLVVQKMENKACELTADNAFLGFGVTIRR
jgi:hypothetical protein